MEPFERILEMNNRSQLTAILNYKLSHPQGVKIGNIGDSISTIGLPANVDYNWISGSVYASQKGVITASAGVTGNTTTQMLARIDADVIAKSPHICFILGGTNDADASTAVSNIEAMILKLLAAKITPVLCTIPPKNTAATHGLRITNTNDGIKKLSHEYNLQVLDFYTLLVDEETGNYLAAYSDDGTHPNTAGKKAMITYAQTNFWAYMNGFVQIYCSNVYTNNLLTNGLFVSDTNADGVPNNWTKSADGVSELVDDATIKGNWVKVTKNNTAVARVLQSISTGFSVGDTINISGLFKSEGLEAVSNKGAVMIYFSGSSDLFYPIAEWMVDISDPCRFSKDFVVPAGATAIGVSIYVTGTGTTGSVSVAQVGLKNLTVLGLV